MDDSGIGGIGFNLFLIALLILANGFFAASEFALVSVRRSWVETLARKGNRRAKVLLILTGDLDRYIAATQLGITMVNLLLGWLGEPALAAAVRPVFEGVLSSFVAATLSHTIAILLAFTLITYLLVILGELVPKTLALERREKIALAVAYPILWFYYLFYPFIRLLHWSGVSVLRVLKLPPATEHRAMYAEEIQQMINLSRERGLLEAHAYQLMTNVFDFSDLLVRNVMRPRGQVTVVDVSTPVDEIIRLFAQTGYSRLPVYRQQLDNIIGVLYSKDVLPLLQHPETIHIENVLRPPLFVPDAASVGEVLRQMLHSKTHFAIVVDEYGEFEGIMTLEDLLEELVGEIRDEHDQEEESHIVKQLDGSWLLDGILTVREVNRRLHLNLPESDEYATVAGFLMTKTGKFPPVGEKIIHQDLCFTVQQIKGRRIARVKLELLSRASA